MRSLALHGQATRDEVASFPIALSDFGRSSNWTAAVQHAVELVIEEWAENVLVYGGGSARSTDHHHQPSTSVPHLWLQVEDHDSHVLLVMRDEGVPFNPLEKSTEPLPDSLDLAQVGGLGLHLMRSFAKSMAYHRESGQNCLQIQILKKGPNTTAP